MVTGPELTAAQRAAIRQVEARSTGPRLPPGKAITLNFHPDRLLRDRSVLGHWLQDPFYRSQFVTATSNGGLTAVPGGDRERWESTNFAEAYDGADPAERPAYGVLNLFGYPYGGAIRFGSAHLELRPEAIRRATFCYPDSAAEPTAFGTAGSFSLDTLAKPGVPDLLDDYVEAHIHGPLNVTEHAALLILDPSFRGTSVEQEGDLLAERGLPVRWHAGFELSVRQLADVRDYRGAEVVELGTKIARDGILNPAIIGAAANTGSHDPQLIKQVWHCLARFGYGSSTGSGNGYE